VTRGCVPVLNTSRSEDLRNCFPQQTHPAARRRSQRTFPERRVQLCLDLLHVLLDLFVFLRRVFYQRCAEDSGNDFSGLCALIGAHIQRKQIDVVHEIRMDFTCLFEVVNGLFTLARFSQQSCERTVGDPKVRRKLNRLTSILSNPLRARRAPTSKPAFPNRADLPKPECLRSVPILLGHPAGLADAGRVAVGNGQATSRRSSRFESCLASEFDPCRDSCSVSSLRAIPIQQFACH